MNTEGKLPPGFIRLTGLPSDSAAAEWQRTNYRWWESHPMRYDWTDELSLPEFSREFYEEIDRRFFADSSRYMPWKNVPFDPILPLDELAQRRVLEIGVGSGSHAQLLAPRCREYTGIDLTAYAVNSTKRRFAHFGLDGELLQMDAEAMEFADGSFDYIWTWGVIHHSANTKKILAEMYRVLRPGGQATVMVYHASLLYVYLVTAFIRGVICGGFVRGRTLHELVQLHTDGAIARFYRPAEWQKLVEDCGFIVERQWIKGQKSEICPLPAGRLKETMMRLVPNSLSRFVTNTCKQGSFLITSLRKPA